MLKEKILVVFGTRPEAIKMAPIILGLSEHGAFNVEVCLTGQHQHMVFDILDLFGIVPSYKLNSMIPGQDLCDLTSRILTGVTAVIKQSRPSMVLVQGDTTTTFAASLAAFYERTPVTHVEAGLRTGDINNPWPEEFNRIMVSKLASIHFAPNEINKENLKSEGISNTQIFVSGNTVTDSLKWVLNRFKQDSDLINRVTTTLQSNGYLPASRDFVLITSHRRENFGRGVESVFQAIRTLAYEFPDVDFVFPVHPNPQVKNIAHLLLSEVQNIYLIPPLEYESFVYLMSICVFIITDSGGIQEEAPSIGKIVLLTREVTERPEGVKAGLVHMVGTCAERIVSSARSLLLGPVSQEADTRKGDFYGDGYAAVKIVDILSNFFRELHKSRNGTIR
jgi:UDP-N-acetylglucosamine 2-epimerase (non-hydrolysing)